MSHKTFAASLGTEDLNHLRRNLVEEIEGAEWDSLKPIFDDAFGQSKGGLLFQGRNRLSDKDRRVVRKALEDQVNHGSRDQIATYAIARWGDEVDILLGRDDG